MKFSMAWMRFDASFAWALHMLFTLCLLLGAGAVPSVRAASFGKPTVVLVHGAFAESSSWDGVVSRLLTRGYPVIAVANPLRGVRSDAEYVTDIVDSIQGTVILVGHSYGGSVITNVAAKSANVRALVYVAAFAPDEGETALALSSRFPGGTLGSALAPPVPLRGGGRDLYIQQSKFHAQFAADVPKSKAALMAATQRPIAASALEEPSGAPAWHTIPAWFVYGTADKNIPPELQPFMAERSAARRLVSIAGGSHVVMVSHPDVVANVILEAARQTAD